jgi:hypothetical protein
MSAINPIEPISRANQMSQERTYKQRDNYATGGFCSKREKCATYIFSSNPNICNKCLRYDMFKFFVDDYNKMIGNNIDEKA